MDHRDEKAFEKIYKDYVKLVYFVISKYVDNKSDTEDLTNEVFVDFCIQMRDVKNVKYFLVSLAKRKAIKYVNDKNRINITYDETTCGDAAGDEESGFDSGYFVIIEDMRKVLDDTETDIIVEHVIFDKTFKEIAKKLGKPLKTVWSTYDRAIKKYKKYREKRG